MANELISSVPHLPTLIPRLDFETKEWSIIRVTGDIPDCIHPTVSFKGFVYMYACTGEPTSSMGFNRTLLMCDMLRFDPSKNHWEVVEAVGQAPEPRIESSILLVDGKIVVIGGMGTRNLARLRRKDEFWYRGNKFDLGCRCNYCWDMELTGEGDWGAFESEDEDEVVVGKDKKAMELGKGEETRACFDSAAEFSSREIAIGEQQVRQELANNQTREDASITETVENPSTAPSQVEPPTNESSGDSGYPASLPAVAPAGNTEGNAADADAIEDLTTVFAERMRMQFRNMPNVKLTKEEMDSVRFKFLFWRLKNDPLSSCYYHDIHVLDLSPSLKTLALMSIADSNPRVDTSYLPPNLHLNLNTMYAFDPEGKKMPALSENEWEMLVYGKGDFRWNLVKTLKEIGAYDGGLFKLFMMEKFLERDV